MGRCAVLLMAMLMGCTSVHRIPAPEPLPPSGAPTQSLSLYTQGLLKAASGDLDGAREALSTARVYDPGAVSILLALAKVEMTAGDILAARKLYANATRVEGARSEAWLELGRVELAFGDAAVGRDALRRAIQLGDSWEARARLISDSLHRGLDPEGLNEWCVRSVVDPVELRVRADLRVKAGDPRGGIDDYLSVLEVRTFDLSLVGPIVSVASQQGMAVPALMGADRVLEQQAHSPAVLMVLGLLSSWVGDHAAAIGALEEAERLGVRLEPSALRALDVARKAAERPATAVPFKPPPLGDPISRSIAAVESNQWDSAEAAIVVGLRESPNDARLLYIRSQLHLKRDGGLAALPHVNRVLQFHPGYGPALNLWAWIQAETGGDLALGEARIREALKAQPRMGSYWDTLGWILHLRGDHKAAQRALSRALRLSPKDDTVREHLKTVREHLERDRGED